MKLEAVLFFVLQVFIIFHRARWLQRQLGIPQQQHLDIGIPTQHPSDRYNGSYFIRLTRLPDDGSRQEPKQVGVIRIIIN
jgi:hypothetical protein